MKGTTEKRGFLFLIVPLLFMILPINAHSKCRYVRVKRVIDGDTFLTANGDRVRLLGVDTPESAISSRPVQWYGKRAYWWLWEQISGKRVCLERDSLSSVNLDRYGRLLRYVKAEGRLINREIIKLGIGRFYHQEPIQYEEEFRALQFEAIKSGRGMWNIKNHLSWIKDRIKRLKLLSNCEKSSAYLCPWDARRFIGKKKRVMLYVSKTHDAGDRFLLNSEVDYRASDNLTVVVFKRGHSGIELDRRFWGQLIELKGKIRLYKDRVEIVVKDPDRIKIIKPGSR